MVSLLSGMFLLASILPAIIPLTVAGVLGWAWYLIQKARWRKQELPFEGIPYHVPNPHWLLGYLPLLGHENFVEGLRLVTAEHAGGDARVSTFMLLGGASLLPANYSHCSISSQTTGVSTRWQDRSITRRHSLSLLSLLDPSLENKLPVA
jgi:hypothetical protein